ncbi:hypothetical protein ESB00_15505 [Oleiharenicola lentus]|uniref:Uncharacterized protein n=1 Tax=Oleiharenicola lentus TaxID=2508720 RepID=A0A4Q1C4A8_9BACT|nr:hypothetical protein [Oleiharenicola lentus]RXK53113.1 hypothetical protein ESB00_15505 [Oleiharenicola lentus]
MNTLSGLMGKHIKLAESYGISRERIILVSNRDKLCAAARSHGDNKDYKETTLGLSIQADDIPGGPDVWIVLRWPVTHEEHQKTYLRLARRGLSPSLYYADTSKPQWLLAFLLLHEVAHHILKHSPAMDYETKEKEADEWAHTELWKHNNDFSG